MRESTLWNYIKKGLLGKWHATRIESSSGNGVPDISYGMPYINGWIELKYVKEWPKRPTTRVKLPLRPEQKHWIDTRGKLSGHVWVICRVQDTFFLIGSQSAIHLAEVGATKADWSMWATLTWDSRIDFDELYNELTGSK